MFGLFAKKENPAPGATLEAMDVARYLLSKTNRSNERGAELTHVKLYALLYYIQAMHISKFGRPLLKTRFSANIHGAVTYDVYWNYHEHGRREIPRENALVVLPASKEELLLIDAVWEMLKNESEKMLRQMIQSEEPWQKTHKPGYNREISWESMQRYYRQSKC